MLDVLLMGTAVAMDYAWHANADDGECHAFPQRETVGLPPPAVCGVRWTVAFGKTGAEWCPTCLAALRDTLRAVSIALGRAGVRLDVALDVPRLSKALARHGIALENVASIGNAEQWREDVDFARDVATTYAELGQPVDQRGDHFAGMPR